MSLLSWLTRSSFEPHTNNPDGRDEKQRLKAELAQQVMRFERRAHTVTQIAEDAIRSMHRGDEK